MNLYVCRNVVFLDKGQENYQDFVNAFLVKYEDCKKLDYFNSTKSKKRFKTVRERRDLYTEDDNFIKFSRGLLEMIPESAYTCTVRKEIDSLCTPRIDLDAIKKTPPHFELRQDQVVAVVKCLVARRGVIQLPTATGKSAIIATVLSQLEEYNPGKLKALILAPTLSTVEGINDTLDEFGLSTSIFGHPKKSIVTPMTTSLVQSLVNQEESNPKLLHEINAVFYDECLPSNASIVMADGTCRTMLQIYEDDTLNEVLSYNVATDEYEPRRILRKFKTPFNDRFCRVYYEDPIKRKTKGVTLTPNHRVYTKNRGYVPASELTSDDLIKVDFPFARGWSTLTSSTYLKVKRVTFNVGKVAEYKYNLEVEKNHNYFANNVLVSNCHHLKCDTWNKLNTMLPNVEYAIGFSALSIDKEEIYATDIREISYTASLITGCSGKVLMHMDPSYYIERGIIALPVVIRIEHNDPLPPTVEESNWTEVSKLGLMSTGRTDKIARVSAIFARYGRKTLILVSERDYAFVLGRFLYQYGVHNFGVSFGAGTGWVCDTLHGTENREGVLYRYEDTMKVLDMLSDGSLDVVIGTSHIDEGVDLKRLDACILACGGKKDRRVIQRVGRVVRKSKTGKYAYIIDFTDSGSRVLSRQSKTRLDMYKEVIGVPESNVFDGISIDHVESKLKELEEL